MLSYVHIVRYAPDNPFRSGLRAFTIIHVNCPQHARSCPKSHALWLHFAAGQTFRTVSKSVLRRVPRRADSTGHYRLRTVTPTSFVRRVFFFYIARVSLDPNLCESNGEYDAACGQTTRIWNYAIPRCTKEAMRLTETRQKITRNMNDSKNLRYFSNFITGITLIFLSFVYRYESRMSRWANASRSSYPALN